MGVFSLNVNAQNNALDFDGINDYVEVPFNSLLSSVKSVEVWAKVNAGTGFYQSPITSRGNFTGFALYAGLDSTWQLWAGNGSVWLKLKGPAISFGIWTHLAGTYDGSDLRLYVNGVLVDSLLASSVLANTTSPLRIGAGNTEATPDFLFGGQVDEVRLWNSTLSGAAIAANMNMSLSGSEPNLVAYYNFNQGIANGNNPTDTTLIDTTANHLVGTLFNFSLSGTTSNWVGSSIVLPINLLSFNGAQKSGTNFLQWSTASEENSNYFEIQRSEDGVHFNSIAKVSAVGNSNSIKNYQYNDNVLSTLSPIYYYRLKMVDIDGSFKYSSVLFIKNNAGGLTTVYPNPARSKITINNTDKGLMNTQASLTDINGKVLQRKPIQQSVTEINISTYLKGIYILKFADGKSIKFVKE